MQETEIRFTDVISASETIWKGARTGSLSSGNPGLEDLLKLINDFPVARVDQLKKQNPLQLTYTMQDGRYWFLIKRPIDEATPGPKYTYS